MKFLLIEETTGRIITGYDSELNKNIPEEAIEISNDIWKQRANNSQLNAFENGALSVKDFRTASEIEYQLKEDNKVARTKACNELIVTNSDGKQFNGDKNSIADLKNALDTAREYALLYPSEAPLTETSWKLYNDSITTVTFIELQEAYVRGNLQYQQTFISFG